MKKNSEDLNNLSNLFFVTHEALQRQTARSIDLALVIRNWLFGWYIVEFEQKGDAKSKYGSGFLTTLSKQLQTLKIKGSSTTRLKLYRSFYLSYSQISPTLSAPSFGLPSIGPTLSDDFINHELREGIKELTTFFQLGWSHYVSLLTIKSETERKFYEIEAHANNWSVRELKRQIESSLYERLALSRNKHQVKELAERGQKMDSPKDLLKNPYILEFLDLPEQNLYSENELENAIIDKIEHFLLELGKGFLFEARQKRFTFDEDHFFVDLVFYNRLLRCYVLIDLKRDKLKHQDLGQMQMYVNYFDRHVKLKDEASTVGIILCHRKNDALVELTLPENSNIHASEYQLYLPSKEELQKQLLEAEKDWKENH